MTTTFITPRGHSYWTMNLSQSAQKKKRICILFFSISTRLTDSILFVWLPDRPWNAIVSWLDSGFLGCILFLNSFHSFLLRFFLNFGWFRRRRKNCRNGSKSTNRDLVFHIHFFSIMEFHLTISYNICNTLLIHTQNPLGAKPIWRRYYYIWVGHWGKRYILSLNFFSENWGGLLLLLLRLKL